MPNYEFILAEPERVEKIVKQHGLKRLPMFICSTELATMEIGGWQTLVREVTGRGESGKEIITIFSYLLPGVEIGFEKNKLVYKESVRGRRESTTLTAHGIGHLLCQRMWWYRIAREVYPKLVQSTEVQTDKPRRWLKILFWKIVYFANPIEVYSRAYARVTWRRYFRAIYGVSYLRSLISEFAQPFADAYADVYMDKLMLDKTVLAVFTMKLEPEDPNH